MISTILVTPLADILADGARAKLLIGREAATELGIAVLEHLEGTPTEHDVRSLVAFAARHEESSPARDALVGVLLNGSGTLPPPLAQLAREAVKGANWGIGRESPGLNADPQVNAVPRRQAFAERLLNERARRIRPRMHAVVAGILARGAAAGEVPSWFLERSWTDLRDSLAQRVRNEPSHRDAMARWLLAQSPAVRARLQAVEDTLVEVVTQAILHAPETAPLEPFLGEDRVAERVRSATTFRGPPARARLATYLSRLAPGTAWHATILAIAIPATLRAG